MTATRQTARPFIGGQFRPATRTVPVIEAATGAPDEYLVAKSIYRA